MPTNQQKDPLLLQATRGEVKNFFENTIPGVLIDFLESDALRDRVLAIVAEDRAKIPEKPSSLLYLPESGL